MGRTGGQETKEKILKTAEKLFSEKGIDATSVDEIAKTTNVNKALIYYHYKNKEDLVTSLFKFLLEELAIYVKRSFDLTHIGKSKQGIAEMIAFLVTKKEIITLMMMESLKKGKHSDLLFNFSEIIITQEKEGIKTHLDKYKKGKFEEAKQLIVHEFFTGFMPIISFVIFQDRFSERFGFESEELVETFIESFIKTHLANHSK